MNSYRAAESEPWQDGCRIFPLANQQTTAEPPSNRQRHHQLLRASPQISNFYESQRPQLYLRGRRWTTQHYKGVYYFGLELRELAVRSST